MDLFDPFHPFNDDNDDDDIFVTIIYRYLMDVLLQSDQTPLLTQRATLNRDREEGHGCLVNGYFADCCVY